MDQYSILGRIGEGAHGIVFKAKHIEVWIKICLFDLTQIANLTLDVYCK